MPHDIQMSPFAWRDLYYRNHRLECRQQEEIVTQLQRYEEDLTNCYILVWKPDTHPDVHERGVWQVPLYSHL